MKNIAPDIFRKRLLIEGYYNIDVTEETIKKFFSYITTNLSLRTYGAPIVHSTNGVGKEVNQGYDAFIPLIDSGIYMGVWVNKRFLSLVIYTCKDFNSDEALRRTKLFFQINQAEHKSF
jgi:S-adenosylmethionine decarboxylase